MKRPNHTVHRQSGMSIGVILVAVALIAVMGMAMVLTEKNGNMTSADNKNRLLANVLIEQATSYRNAYLAMMQAKGMPYWNPDLTTSGFWSMTDPNQGYTEPQTPPVDAYVSPTSAIWIFKKDTNSGNATVTLMNVGTVAPDFTIATVNLNVAVCQQLNKVLSGSTVIPVETVGTSAAWSNPFTVMDLSSEAAVNGKASQCVRTTDGQYVFYSTLRIM